MAQTAHTKAPDAGNTPLYERDFHAWTEQQAALLRAGHLAGIDTDHLAEEIESMGASQRRELHSRLRVLAAHLLKWRHQPQARSSGWRGTIRTQRYELDLLLQQSPSLKSRVPDALAHSYPPARTLAADETGLALTTFPETCPFTLEPGQSHEKSSALDLTKCIDGCWAAATV